MTKKYILGLDIGGTSMKWGAYAITNSKLNNVAIAEGSEATLKGNPEFLYGVSNLVENIVERLDSRSTVSAIGIALPGRFIGDNHDIIAAHTAHNLCKSKDRKAFDNFAMVSALKEYLPSHIPLRVQNDAVVQMLGQLHSEYIDSQILTDEVIGYIGPGTGLGGGFAKKVAPHQYEVVTDGHINHTLLNLNSDDLALVKSIEAKRNISFPKRGDLYTAEGLFCGTALEQLCGLLQDEARSLDNNELIIKYRQEIELSARVLATLILTLRSGSFEKLNPEDTWPVSDQSTASQVKTFLFGGGMAQSNFIGDMILQEAKHYLAKHNITDIKFLKTSKNPTIYAAANMALDLL